MFIFDFFDKDKDCPDNLKELKKQYFDELEELGKTCKNCELKQLRDKYIEIIISL